MCPGLLIFRLGYAKNFYRHMKKLVRFITMECEYLTLLVVFVIKNATRIVDDDVVTQQAVYLATMLSLQCCRTDNNKDV